jgi:hypothetical protein
MDSSGHLPVSDSAARPLSKGKRGRPKKKVAANSTAAPQREPAAVGTLTRTKSLLAAALKVWELKQRGLGG